MLLRATAGAGFAWTDPLMPLTAFSIGIGTHNEGARLLAELERVQSRAHASETQYDFRNLQNAISRPIVAYRAWYSLRFGIEVPAGPTRHSP